MACSARMPGKASIDGDPVTHSLRAVDSSQTRNGSIDMPTGGSLPGEGYRFVTAEASAV